MFNINIAVKVLRQRKYDHTHGLPDKPKQYDKKVVHIDGLLYEDKAEYEHGFIIRCFKNYSKDFGRRLSKRRGQYHKPGGGYAGCIIKERKLLNKEG